MWSILKRRSILGGPSMADVRTDAQPQVPRTLPNAHDSGYLDERNKGRFPQGQKLGSARAGIVQTASRPQTGSRVGRDEEVASRAEPRLGPRGATRSVEQGALHRLPARREPSVL
jgi:hypothetical protein